MEPVVDPSFRRRLYALGRSIDLATNDSALAGEIDRVFVDVPERAVTPAAELHLERVGDGQFQLRGSTPWAGNVGEREAFPRLVTALNRLLLDLASDALCIHAAGFETEEGVHGLIGRSGVGKTTLLIELMRHGTTALNDEMVCLGSPSLEVISWPKPLSVKPGVHAGVGPQNQPDVSGRQFRSVPLSEVGQFTTSPGALASMIFLRRSGTMTIPSATKLSPADAMVALGDHFMNFRTFGSSQALTVVAAAVSQCATWTLNLADPAQNARFVSAEIEQVERNAVDWSLIERAEPPVVAGCITVALGDELVIWSPESEHLVALDKAGAALWLELTDGRGDGLLQHDSFVRSLVGHGLLDRDWVLDRRRSSTR